MGRPKKNYDTQGREYRAWSALKSRCQNPNDHHYKNWGGRGIKVCSSWQVFENFLADMGECPDGMTIERKDNNGDYEPGNCVWATMRTQRRNTRQNVFLSHVGKTLTVTDWAELLGVPRGVLFQRLRHGWTVERTLDEPVAHKPPKSL